MKAYHCPIDTSLNYSQANKLVRELRPRELALPEQYAAPAPGSGGGGTKPHVACDAPTLVLRRGGARRCGVRRGRARAWLDPALAAALQPREVRPGLRAAPLCASLRVRDNRVELLAPPATLAPRAAWPPPAPPDVEALMRALGGAEGDARVERGAGAGEGCIVHVPRRDALLHVERHATHVFCSGDAEGRRALRRALQQATEPHRL